jgi:hypothetical protein
MSERETQHQIRRAVRRTLLHLQLAGVPPFATWIAILSLQERENAVVRLFRLDKQDYVQLRPAAAFWTVVGVINVIKRHITSTTRNQDLGWTEWQVEQTLTRERRS